MAAARSRSRFFLPVLAVVLLMAQGAYWYDTRDIRPVLDVVPDVPSEAAVHALALGDEQAYFRVLGLYLQNSGDTFGRFTALRHYDFSRLYLWMKLLDTLDRTSNMVPSLATYYYGMTQHTIDLHYMVDYLYEHATADIPKKWWWLLQSIYLAQHRLEDPDLAMKVAAPLVHPGVPVWAQQMAAVMHEKRGEMEAALAIMESIANNAESLSDADLKYMSYFVDERLKALEEQKRKEALQHSIEERLKHEMLAPPEGTK